MATAAATTGVPLELARMLVSEMPHGSAVYFLFLGQEVVYVGASSNPHFRVSRHTKKRFDSAAFLAVSEAELLDTERHWIGVLRPKYNRQNNPANRGYLFRGGRSKQVAHPCSHGPEHKFERDGKQRCSRCIAEATKRYKARMLELWGPGKGRTSYRPRPL